MCKFSREDIFLDIFSMSMLLSLFGLVKSKKIIENFEAENLENDWQISTSLWPSAFRTEPYGSRGIDLWVFVSQKLSYVHSKYILLTDCRSSK